MYFLFCFNIFSFLFRKKWHRVRSRRHIRYTANVQGQRVKGQSQGHHVK